MTRADSGSAAGSRGRRHGSGRRQARGDVVEALHIAGAGHLAPATVIPRAGRPAQRGRVAPGRVAPGRVEFDRAGPGRLA